MPRFDNLSPEELEEIKRFIEETDIDLIDDEMRERGVPRNARSHLLAPLANYFGFASAISLRSCALRDAPCNCATEYPSFLRAILIAETVL